MSAQALSRRTLRMLTRRFALPFTYGWARGERWYRLHTYNHTIYCVMFHGTRPGRRQYVLSGPYRLCSGETHPEINGCCTLNERTP